MSTPLDEVRHALGLQTSTAGSGSPTHRPPAATALRAVAAQGARRSDTLDDDVRLALLGVALVSAAVAVALPFVVPALARHPELAGASQAVAVLAWPHLLVPVLASGISACALLVLGVWTRGFVRVGELEGYLALAAAGIGAVSCLGSVLVIVAYLLALVVAIVIGVVALVLIVGVVALFLAG